MKKWIGFALVSLVGLFFIDQMTIDRCLDSGGRWVWSDFRCDR